MIEEKPIEKLMEDLIADGLYPGGKPEKPTGKTILLSPETVEAYKKISEKGVTVQAFRSAMTYKPKEWQILFSLYNQFNKPLGMGCFPCYGKVYQFVSKVIKDNGHD